MDGPDRPQGLGRQPQTAASNPPVLQLAGVVSPCDIDPLCERARRMLRGSEMLVCDVEDLHADAVAVEALARLQLTARRMRRCLLLSHVRDELRELIELVGLREVLPSVDADGAPHLSEER